MNLLKNFKIRTKITLLIFIAIIGLIAIGTIGFVQLHDMGNKLDDMYKNKLQSIDTVSLLQSNNQIVEKSMIELLITTDETRNNELLNEIEKRLNETDKILASYQTDNKDELEVLDKLEELSTDIEKPLAEVTELAAKNQNDEAYEIYTTTADPIMKQIDTNYIQLIQINREDAKSVNEQNKDDVQASNALIISITILSLVLFSLISWAIITLIVKPIKGIESLMKLAEEGDLSVQSTYQSKDEIGSLTLSFNNMLSKFNEVISKIQFSSDQVAASSEQLMTSAEESNRASEQIAEASTTLATSAETSVRETDNASTAIQEMAMGINHITESISLVSEHSNTTTEESEKGNISLKKTIEQMNSINSTVLSSSSIIKELGQRSKEIENIVEMISGISNQTNLLALNAAIEAARAGEHGKGFAVVADEVRKLAEESNRSAEQITHLIHEIQTNTLHAVDSMDKCITEMKTGLTLITETGESFNQILQSATDVSKQSEEVTAAAEEMSASVEQTAYGILEISKNAETSASTSQTVAAGTEEQLASIEEITTSAQTLAKMAEELQSMVTMFKIK
ncbi:methyl-accepting chemotaxis protein [Metabacillus malikii]|uniref:Methyl-accepting chemotaxis protein n=1 Tax=Metabacillus malikii TaxID=1504265 RepID=A0ABT9ZDK2_9BACI|nr:methyl-accepting chemotaxis protein [Metabacillus malikii]MDQ0230337.1 methyl-accepting chemotaxis protein [Metabacillus malikii]